MAKIEVDRFYEDFRKVEIIERQIKQHLDDRATALKNREGTGKVRLTASMSDRRHLVI